MYGIPGLRYGDIAGARVSTESPNRGKDHSPPARLVVVLAALVGAAVLLRTCATPVPALTEYQQAMAYHEPGFRPLPAHVRHVDDPHEMCIALGMRRPPEPYVIRACADPYGDVVPDQCTVILPHRAPAFLVEHEILHCKRGAWHQ